MLVYRQSTCHHRRDEVLSLFVKILGNFRVSILARLNNCRTTTKIVVDDLVIQLGNNIVATYYATRWSHSRLTRGN
jgi:hypothetical protein